MLIGIKNLICERDWKYIGFTRSTITVELSFQVFISFPHYYILNKISASENSSPGDKFHFVLEASRRSNATCLQLFAKDIESCTGELAASSIVSRCLNDQGNISPSLCDQKVLCCIFICYWYWDGLY